MCGMLIDQDYALRTFRYEVPWAHLTQRSQRNACRRGFDHQVLYCD